MKDESFYCSFEDRFRGSRELIKSRLRKYLPFILPLKTIYEERIIVDLGCGRGEWLELITEAGFQAQGVDLNDGMLDACIAAGLSTKKEDAIKYLQSLQDESILVVSGFHIIEHIPFDALKTLVMEAFRVLKPGGLLILETPNPENLKVSETDFYLDPTHQRPVPPQLLHFLAEYNNFSRIKLLRINESRSLRESDNVHVTDIFFGVSPDYSIVAQKSAPESHMSLFDQQFNEEYGLTVDDLIVRYEENDQKLIAYEHERWQWLENEWNATKKKIEAQAADISRLREGSTLLEGQLSERFQALDSATLALSQERDRSQWLVNEWNTAKTKIDAQAAEILTLKSETALIEDQLSERSQAIDAQAAEISALREQATLLEGQLLRISSELDSERMKSQWLENEWNASKAREENAHMRLQSAYSSYSWRITAPLRMSFDLFLRAKEIFLSIPHILGHKLRDIAFLMLNGSINFAIAHPRLKSSALVLVHKSPRFDSWLHEFYISRRPVGKTPETTISLQALSSSNLSPNARRIYIELKAAIERNRRGN